MQLLAAAVKHQQARKRWLVVATLHLVPVKRSLDAILGIQVRLSLARFLVRSDMDPAAIGAAVRIRKVRLLGDVGDYQI